MAGSLVVLITFFTSYSHVDIPSHASIAVNQQIGIPLLLADSPRSRLQLNQTATSPAHSGRTGAIDLGDSPEALPQQTGH